MQNNRLFPLDQISKKLAAYTSKAETLMILGSGWNHVIDHMKVTKTVTYADVFGSDSSVPGHESKLVLGKVQGTTVWAMAGRFHTYEGYTAAEVTLPLQAFAQLGVTRVIICSAAGQLNEEFTVGDIVVLSDILTIFCQSPFTGPVFQDLSQPFSLEWRKQAIALCEKYSISNQESGTYVYMRGPHYESYADKRALQVLGADCVGMSMVPEVLVANNLSMQVLGLAAVTNLAFDLHSHEEVVANAEQQQDKMAQLLAGLVVDRT